jgi:hypothetical protein
MTTKSFYRVGSVLKGTGLWYDDSGKLINLAKTQFNLKSGDLPMGYDPNIVGYLSVTDTLDNLLQWFTLDEMITLKDAGYKLMCFDVDVNSAKLYTVPLTDVQHWIIPQETSNFRIIDWSHFLKQ